MQTASVYILARNRHNYGANVPGQKKVLPLPEIENRIVQTTA
jgi:hypothetical protein